MYKQNALMKALGFIILAFGCGVLIAFFLPTYFLAVIEAAVIIASGILCILQK